METLHQDWVNYDSRNLLQESVNPDTIETFNHKGVSCHTGENPSAKG